jgi:hypothetical protein
MAFATEEDGKMDEDELFEKMWKTNRAIPSGTTLKKVAEYYFKLGLKANANPTPTTRQAQM